MPVIGLAVRWWDAGEGSGEGATPGKKIFLYTGSVVTVSASSSFIAVSRLNARLQSVGPTYLKVIFSVDMFFSGVL